MTAKQVGLAAASTVFFIAGLVCAADPPADRLVVRSWNLCDYQTDLDGQWQGSVVASDGACYFASSTHSGRTGAMFFRFDPRTRKLAPLCKDLTRVCGEDPARHKPQGKVHSDVMEIGGWLYFSTHLSYYHAKPAGEYTGSHVIGYNMASGKFRDLGIPRAGYTNYSALVGDPKNRRLYIYLVDPQQRSDKPSYLYRIDLPEGKTRILGELPAGGFNSSIAHMFCDPGGNVWFTLRDGTLMRYDPAADKLARMGNVGPHMRWVQAIPGTNLAAVSMDRGSTIGIFDPSAPKGRMFRPVAETGGRCSYITLGGEVVYFVRDPGRRALSRTPKNLMAVNIRAARPVVVDYGVIVDQDGRRPLRIPALAADADGRVYMTGDWQTNPGDKATTRLRRDRRTGRETYPVQRRSQRFAFVKVDPPTK